MAERVKNNLAKKKSTEDEFMKQTEQNQKDDLEFASAPVTGGASSSQGPLPPKAKVERSRSRDQEPKTPKSEMKSEMKSESEATPKVKKEPKEKKIKVKK